METYIKIESRTKFVHCLFSLKMCIFIAFRKTVTLLKLLFFETNETKPDEIEQK